MKKILIFLTLFLFVFLFFGVNLHSESLDDSRFIGRTVDISKDPDVTNKNINFVNGIFNNSWINNKRKNSIQKRVINDFVSTSNYFDDFVDIRRFYLSNYNGEIDATIPYKKVDIKINSIFTSSYAKKMFSSKYFAYYNKSIKHKKFSLSFDLNMNEFRENLNQEFINDVKKLSMFSTVESYAKILRKYGTHVLMEGVFGGELNLDYSIYTSNINVTNDDKIRVKNNVITSFLKIFSGPSGSKDFDFLQTNSTTLKTTQYKFNVRTLNGGTYNFTNHNNYSKNINDWIKSLDQNYGLIGATKTGLIPIWEFIPSNLLQRRNSKELFYQAYKRMISNSLNEKVETLSNIYYHKNHSLYLTSNDYRYNRYHVIKITDLVNRPVDFLIDEGYKKIDLKLIFRYKNVADGYRWFGIFDDVSRLPENKVAEYITAYENDGYKEVIFNDLYLNSFNNDIVFGFSASGAGSDDWEISNFSIKYSIY